MDPEKPRGFSLEVSIGCVRDNLASPRRMGLTPAKAGANPSQLREMRPAGGPHTRSAPLPQPNPGLPGFGHLRFAGSGQARSRLGRGWGWGSESADTPRATTTTPTPPASAALRRATLPTRGEGKDRARGGWRRPRCEPEAALAR